MLAGRVLGLIALCALINGACAPAEGFRGTASGSGGAPGSGGLDGAIGSGGNDPGGAAGTGGDVGSGGVGGDNGSGGSGGAVVDASADGRLGGMIAIVIDGSADRFDAGPETGQALTFEDHCLRARWSATASPYSSLAPNAIDGDPETMWQTFAPQIGNEWLQIDMGDVVRVSQLVLDNSAGNDTDYPRGFKVQASTDGATFNATATTVAQGPAGAVTTINFAPINARALRILQTGSDPTFWWSVHELRVACRPAVAPPAGAIDPFDPRHWVVMASSSIGGSGPGNAIDGDYNTRWTSGVHQQGNEWFLIDLGAPGPVAEVWLITKMSPNDFPAQYVLETSMDGKQYAMVAGGMGQTVLKIKIPPTVARYVRIRQTGQTAAQGGSWWSIDELSVRP